MTALLAGIKVVEVASWLAAPSCAALMADMGAEVIKVEPPGGDTYRRMYSAMLGEDFVHLLPVRQPRQARRVCQPREDPEGLALVHELAAECDVFITNLTQERLQRYALTDADIHRLAPQAVFAVLSGYGTTGPDSDRQAFDQTAFWGSVGRHVSIRRTRRRAGAVPWRLWRSHHRTESA